MVGGPHATRAEGWKKRGQLRGRGGTGRGVQRQGLQRRSQRPAKWPATSPKNMSPRSCDSDRMSRLRDGVPKTVSVTVAPRAPRYQRTGSPNWSGELPLKPRGISSTGPAQAIKANGAEGALGSKPAAKGRSVGKERKGRARSGQGRGIQHAKKPAERGLGRTGAPRRELLVGARAKPVVRHHERPISSWVCARRVARVRRDKSDQTGTTARRLQRG